MKSPQVQQQSPPTKALESSPGPTGAAFAPSFFYEPTSVLDHHLTSSPASGGGAGDGAGGGPGLPPIVWDLLPPVPPPSDDWDPVADWLLSGDKDDLAHPPPPSFVVSDYHSGLPDSFDNLPPFSPFEQEPQFNRSPNPPPPSFDRAHLDLLIRAAQAVESSDLQMAHMILTRLNHHLPIPAGGGPLQRAAFHFRDALLALLPVPDTPSAEPPLSPLELVRRITAHKVHSDLSPVPQFAGFTANQTLLENLDTAPALHLIDFDLGFGGQWSSFTQEIAARSRAARRPPPSVRITAVVPDDSPEATLAAENLRDFARGLGLRLTVDFVRVGGVGAPALAGVRLAGGGEAAAVVLTPAVFRLLGGAPESDTALLRFVRRVAPRVVVFIDNEPFVPASSSHLPSFRRGFASGLEFYAAVLESLDATAVAAGVGDEAVRRVERSVIRPRVFAAVGSCGARSTTWRETFTAAGMTPVPFSEFTEWQAELLLRRAPVEGFRVARREGAMVLSWRGRELAATSAWRC